MQLFLVGLATLMVLAPTAQGQVPFLGRCPKVKLQQNFNAVAYKGLWYENKKYFVAVETVGICVTALYTVKLDGTIAVTNRQYNTILNRYESIMGTAKIASTTGEGKLTVRFPSVGNFPGDYLVLGTDYTSYAVVWSCRDYLLFNLQSSWVLTRDKSPSTAVLAKADLVLNNNKIYLPTFIDTNQKDCPT